MTKRYRVSYFVKCQFDVEVDRRESRAKERLAAEKVAEYQLAMLLVHLRPCTNEYHVDSVMEVDDDR